MPAFDYGATQTIDEAVTLLAAPGARPLAGGTDLIVQLRRGERDAALLVDVKRIPELLDISFDPSGALSLGAAVTCSDIAEHPQIVAAYPALADAARLIGGTAIRNRATVGGNLCNAAPSADAIPVLLVLDARCIVRGPSGTRSVRAAEFCTGPGTTVLQPGELLVSLRLPPPGGRTGARYLRFIPRGEMDIAVAGAACMIRLEEQGDTIAEAGVALAAVARTPLEVPGAAAALTGRAAGDEAFEQAARAAREAARPITDHRGTAALRTHLAGVLVRRALGDALRRARGEQLDA